jgi:hypothetical protein
MLQSLPFVSQPATAKQLYAYTSQGTSMLLDYARGIATHQANASTVMFFAAAAGAVAFVAWWVVG